MKFILQGSYPSLKYRTHAVSDPELEYGKLSTFATSACGLASSIMVLDRLYVNSEFYPKDAVELSYECGANHQRGTDYALYAPAFAQKFNLIYKKANTIEELRNCLATGGAAVVHVARNKETGYEAIFTTGGHYMTVISNEPDGRFAILDPGFAPSKFESERAKKEVQIVDERICLVSAETLMAETDARDGRRFHLFWRNDEKKD